jgi:hypothetical protein
MGNTTSKVAKDLMQIEEDLERFFAMLIENNKARVRLHKEHAKAFGTMQASIVRYEALRVEDAQRRQSQKVETFMVPTSIAAALHVMNLATTQRDIAQAKCIENYEEEKNIRESIALLEAAMLMMMREPANQDAIPLYQKMREEKKNRKKKASGSING